MSRIPWLLLFLVACGREDEGSRIGAEGPDPAPAGAPRDPAAAAEPILATAALQPASGSTVTGRVSLEAHPQGTHAIIQASGLTPGPHAVHVHETGDCSAADASSAGPHLSEPGQTHGAPGEPGAHSGDLGNFAVSEEGTIEQDVVIEGVTPKELVGRAFVIHAGRDDLRSQPAGDSGSRIACGVVREAT